MFDTRICRQCFININAFVPGPSQVEDKRPTHYDDLNSAMEKFNYGRHIIPVTLIQKPEERYRAREAQQSNVEA